VIPRLDQLPEGPEGIDARRAAMADRGVGGPANPAGVEMAPRREGDEAIADVRFGAAFEGALGRVHGGMVAAVFDDVTGFVLAFIGEPGFTGRLTISYRAPVPVETTIEFRARLRERDGRKLYVDADARLDGTLLATAEAMFIMVDHDHFATSAADLLRERQG
jgi:acyl-coenzyme A thioesterase PaaI-like protein